MWSRRDIPINLSELISRKRISIIVVCLLFSSSFFPSLAGGKHCKADGVICVTDSVISVTRMSNHSVH